VLQHRFDLPGIAESKVAFHLLDRRCHPSSKASKEGNKAICLFFACVFLLSVLPAQAQSIALAPAELQYTFQPGAPFQFELSISNDGARPTVMRASVTDLWYNDKNEKLFTPPGTSPRSAANWMEVVPPQITVPAGGTGKVKVVVTPPPQASGGYYAVVFLESRPELAQQATADTQAVYANFRLGSLILLSARNTEEFAVQISDPQLTPPSRNQTLKLDFSLSNNSNTHIFPETKLAILNERHELVAKAEGEIRRFLPLEKNRLAVSWAGALPAGTYSAILTVLYGPHKIETKEFPFKVAEAP
jgi:hypothetical protein